MIRSQSKLAKHSIRPSDLIMLSHLHKVWELILHLGASLKIKLSRSEQLKAKAKALKLLNLIKSHNYAEALELGSSYSQAPHL
jgi:hypothetical protein